MEPSTPGTPSPSSPSILTLLATDRLKQLGYDPDLGKNQRLEITFKRTGDHEGEATVLPTGIKSTMDFRHWTAQTLDVGVPYRMVVYADGKSEFYAGDERIQPNQVMTHAMDHGYGTYKAIAQELGRLEKILPTVEVLDKHIAEGFDEFNDYALLNGDFAAIAAGMDRVRLTCPCGVLHDVLTGQDDPSKPELDIVLDIGHGNPVFPLAQVVVREAGASQLARYREEGIARFRQRLLEAPGKLDAAIQAKADADAAAAAPAAPVEEPVADGTPRGPQDDTVVRTQAEPVEVDGGNGGGAPREGTDESVTVAPS